MTDLTVLVFGPESVSYERSRRETAAKFNHFVARVFFVKIPQSQYSMIYTIFMFFRIHIPKIDSFPMLFSHPTRPPGRPPARPPVMDHRLSKWLYFQYFQVHNWIKMNGFPVCPGSNWIKMTGFQYKIICLIKIDSKSNIKIIRCI